MYLFSNCLLLLLFFPPQRMLKSIETHTHVYTLPHYCRRVCKITPTVSSLTRSNVSSHTQEHASMRTHKHKHKHTRIDTHTHTHSHTHTHTLTYAHSLTYTHGGKQFIQQSPWLHLRADSREQGQGE